MSTCEAELVALAECALEILYIVEVLKFIGHEVTEPVEVCTDSKAAYDLCHRYSAAQHTKHIDRKMFKMRELRGAGCVTVRHLPGEKDPADLFTKVLCRQDFEKHRAVVLNTRPENSFISINVGPGGTRSATVADHRESGAESGG